MLQNLANTISPPSNSVSPSAAASPARGSKGSPAEGFGQYLKENNSNGSGQAPTNSKGPVPPKESHEQRPSKEENVDSRTTSTIQVAEHGARMESRELGGADSAPEAHRDVEHAPMHTRGGDGERPFTPETSPSIIDSGLAIEGPIPSKPLRSTTLMDTDVHSKPGVDLWSLQSSIPMVQLTLSSAMVPVEGGSAEAVVPHLERGATPSDSKHGLAAGPVTVSANFLIRGAEAQAAAPASAVGNEVTPLVDGRRGVELAGVKIQGPTGDGSPVAAASPTVIAATINSLGRSQGAVKAMEKPVVDSAGRSSDTLQRLKSVISNVEPKDMSAQVEKSGRLFGSGADNSDTGTSRRADAIDPEKLVGASRFAESVAVKPVNDFVPGNLGQPSQTLITAVQENSNWSKMLSAPTVQFNETVKPNGQVLQSLNITLNPVELGKLELNLKMTQGKVTIEVRAESDRAYRALLVDQDALANTMRGLGFKVDAITISGPQTDNGPQFQNNGQFQNGRFGGDFEEGTSHRDSHQQETQEPTPDLTDLSKAEDETSIRRNII